MSSPEAASDLATLRTQVTPENVMLLHNTLASEAQYLRSQVVDKLSWPLGLPGNDLVSPQANAAYGAKINGLRTQMRAYVQSLVTAADEIAKVAQSYGHTETEISDSFRKFYSSYGPQQPSGASSSGISGLGW